MSLISEFYKIGMSPTLIMGLAVGPCHDEDVSADAFLHLVRGC